MKTKTTILIATIAALITCSVYGENAVIPLKSQILLQKLQKWESEEKEQFDAQVNKKKQVVAGVLKTHLTEVTKKGDLKGANALQAQITKLTGEKAIVADSDTADKDDGHESVKTPKSLKGLTDAQIEQIFINTRWELYRSSYSITEIGFGERPGEGYIKSRYASGNNWKVKDGKLSRWHNNSDGAGAKWWEFDVDLKRNIISFAGIKYRKVRKSNK